MRFSGNGMSGEGTITGHVNSEALDRAIRSVVVKTDEESLEVVNRALLHVIIGGSSGGKRYNGAVQGTRRATRKAIEKYWAIPTARERKIHSRFLIRFAAVRVRERNIKFAEDKFTTTKTGKLKWESPYHRAVLIEARKILARSIMGIGYTARMGWDQAIRALGGRGFKRQRRFSSSEARHGKAERAKRSGARVVATALNTAPGIKVAGGDKALDQAMGNVARDITEHQAKKALMAAAKKAGFGTTGT